MINERSAPTDRPCAADPEHWDLDNGVLVDWLDAIQQCIDCPVARACRQLTLDQLRAGTPPLGLVQSGVAFTATGRELDPLQLPAHAARVARHRERPGRAA